MTVNVSSGGHNGNDLHMLANYDSAQTAYMYTDYQHDYLFPCMIHFYKHDIA